MIEKLKLFELKRIEENREKKLLKILDREWRMVFCKSPKSLKNILKIWAEMKRELEKGFLNWAWPINLFLIFGMEK